MVKTYERINWKNNQKPSINETNLNKIDVALNEIDNRVVQLANETSPLENRIVNTTIPGINPTITDSADAPLVYMNNAGYTNQNVPLFDGKWTTLNNGIKTTNIIPCENGDVLTIQCASGVDVVNVYNADNEAIYLGASIKPVPTSKNITIDQDTLGGVYVELNTTDTNVTILVNGSAYATPTPDVPIRIASNGDKGYFDGVLSDKWIDMHGSITTPSTKNITVIGANKIKCKQDDVINIIYEESVSYIIAVFYKSDGTFIERPRVENVNTMSVTAPSEADYFMFGIENENGITPSSAKHISVTINGNYALRVETTGKNLLENTATTTTTNGITLTVNNNGSVTANGTSTDALKLEIGRFVNNGESANYITNGCPSGGSSSKYEVLTNVSSVAQRDYGSGVEYTLDSGVSAIVSIVVRKGVTLPNLTFYPMIRRSDIKDATYEPHKSTTALIPVSAPFYEGDFIEVYADGSGQIYRANSPYTLKSSNLFHHDSSWADGVFRFEQTPSDIKPYSGTNTTTDIVSTHFPNAKLSDMLSNSVSNGISILNNTIFFKHESITTSDNFKTWLGENDVKIIYPLKTPTTEPLTAEQVAEFLKLQTFKGVTYVNADGEITIRYYVDTLSGETMGMLQKMIQGIS